MRGSNAYKKLLLHELELGEGLYMADVQILFIFYFLFCLLFSVSTVCALDCVTVRQCGASGLPGRFKVIRIMENKEGISIE